MDVKKVWNEEVVVDEDLLPRIKVDDDTRERYAELVRLGYKLPPIVLFEIDGKLYLVDGLHRLRAYEAVHYTGHKFKVEVEIHRSSRSDAMWYAAGANQEHGLPLSLEQRRRAVKLLLSDKATAKRADSSIAKQCGVSPSTVAKYRREVQTTFQFGKCDQRITSDGRVMDTTKIGRKTVAGPDDDGQGVLDEGDEGLSGGNAEGLPGDDGQEDLLDGVDRGDEQLSGVDDSPAEDLSEQRQAQWPEPIRDVILEGTETLKDLASDCRKLENKIKQIEELRRPGTAMFHAGAARERVRRLKRAIARAIPHCVCADCKGEGCDSCGQRGWKLRTELDENSPTEKQLLELADRSIDATRISKMEASRRLDDIFVVERWQDRRARKEAAQEPQEAMSW